MPSFTPPYRNYVLCLLLAGYLLNSFDRSILGVLLEPIRLEFGVSDASLGLLGGLAFAAFYSTLGIPIAMWADRWSRRNVLALSVALWTVMTALCGLAATFPLLVLARIGTAVGESGASPASQSLIASYFTTERRATALAIFALGAPAGAMLAGLLGGAGNEMFGWRTTFVLAGVPGLLLAPLVLLTVNDSRPGRGLGAHSVPRAAHAASPREVAAYLWQRPSFRHLCLACAFLAMAIYSTATFNGAFLMRSHDWNTAAVGQLMALSGAFGIAGTFLGGYLADRLRQRRGDQRWYLWIPAISTLLLAPCLLVAYLTSNSVTLVVTFAICGFLSTVFFGPSFATTQALATERMRAVAAAVLIFVKTVVGMGLGPLVVGTISDALGEGAGQQSLRYALLTSAVFAVLSCAHFLRSAQTLRADIRSVPASDLHAAETALRSGA
jgi:predicted MFS family arabinose efflux permease